jgi:hypothetical protein
LVAGNYERFPAGTFNVIESDGNCKNRLTKNTFRMLNICEHIQPCFCPRPLLMPGDMSQGNILTVADYLEGGSTLFIITVNELVL